MWSLLGFGFSLIVATVRGTAVARFEVAAVDSRSIVVRMVGTTNVTRFDLDVQIFDLDRLSEFRRSGLSTTRYRDQLFSFDGLSASTWFAVRIEYRIVFRSLDGFRDFKTKQELIVRTKDLDDEGQNRVIQMDGGDIGDRLLQLEGIVTDAANVNVTVLSLFPIRSETATLIVPELSCERGVVKPPAQRLHHRRTHIHFDLQRLSPSRNSDRKSPNCNRLCIYPFIRAPISGHGVQSFRGREWCGSLEEAYEVIGTQSEWISSFSSSLYSASFLSLFFVQFLF